MPRELQSSFTTLFGTVQEEEGAEARSVLSPAAYLVDLLQLRDGLISAPPNEWAGYHARRPDVRRIPLDGTNTFTEVPVLGIVNEVMSSAITQLGSPPSVLMTSLFPPPLPFSEHHEILKRYANKLGSGLDEIYHAFQDLADGHEAARLSLGLSPEEFSLFSTSHLSDDQLKALWGTTNLAELDGSNLELIQQKLGVSLKELQSLLRQDLDDQEAAEPIGAQARFFINQGSDYLVLSDDGRKLQLKNGHPLSHQHLDRLMRFVRLSRRLAIDFVDFGWVLESSCANILDKNALQTIAIILAIQKEHGLPIDEICTFWGTPKAHGRGEGPLPGDLFSRIFNNGFATTLEALVIYLLNTNITPETAQTRLDDRLQAALRLSGADYAFLQAMLLSRGIPLPVLNIDSVVQYASLLQRFAALARALSLGIKELMTLIDVLNAQWETAAHDDFRVSMPFSSADGEILEPPPASNSPHGPVLGALISPDSPPRTTLNALQKLFRVKAWLDRRALSPRQLAFICTGDNPAARARLDDGSPIEGVLTNDEIEAVLGDVHQTFSDMLLTPHQFQTGSLTPDGARAVFASLRTARILIPIGDENGALLRTQPSGAELSAAVLSGVRERLQIHASDLNALGIPDVIPLLVLLVSRGYLEKTEDTASDPAETDYFIEEGLCGFFSAPDNMVHFMVPGFEEQREAVFGMLSAKVEAYQRALDNQTAETKEIRERLNAHAEQQLRAWLRVLTSFLEISADLAELLFSFAFGTEDEPATQTLAALTVPLFSNKHLSSPALSDAFLASRFRRLQQLGLLFRKTAMSADEARVCLDNQNVHLQEPETLKLPWGFFATNGKIDALTMLPCGDFLVISGQNYATFSCEDYRLLDSGLLDQIPGVLLPEAFRAGALANGIDCAFSDTSADGKPVLYLCMGDQYIAVSQNGTQPARPITDWGRVRNNIQQNAHIDTSVEAKDGRLFLFSGDQYFRYSHPQQLLTGNAFTDEGYPKAIRRGLENEGLPPLPSLMHTKIDAAFRDTDDSYYFFLGSQFTHSGNPYQLIDVRSVWGHVLNYLFDENRVDAAFVVGHRTFLTRRDQLIRYSGNAYTVVDEGYPVRFANIPESDTLLRVLKRFPEGIDAALAGKDQNLYAFRNGFYASSADPDHLRAIRERWGRVRNEFVINERVDAALTYNGSVYLFCGDQYIRYSSSGYEIVDEGYPKRVQPNWNSIEQAGSIPEQLPLPITAAAVGQSSDVFFFGGNQFSRPNGTLGEVKDVWARVRNNIEQLGRVDAALTDESGSLYLFSGDQLYRYADPYQAFVDEGYPLRLLGNWLNPMAGWTLPDTFGAGISSALRAPNGRIYMFSGQHYARVDTMEPARTIKQDWGLVRNHIATDSRVSAAFIDPEGSTYLFGGDQYIRYSTDRYGVVDEGYPKAIGDQWGDLPPSFREGIDAALAFTVQGVPRLYLFKGRHFVRYSNGNYTQIDEGYPKRIEEGEHSEGKWFRGFAIDHMGHYFPHHHPIVVEGIYVDSYQSKPRICLFYRHRDDEHQHQWTRQFRAEGDEYEWTSPREVADLSKYAPFRHIDAGLLSSDGTLHLFSGEMYAFRAPEEGHLSPPVLTRERWAHVRNSFQETGRVDASLVLADGRTYLFCANQFMRYTGELRPGDGDFYTDEGYPKTIAPNWTDERLPIALPEEFQAEGCALFQDGAGIIHLFNGPRYTRSDTPGLVYPVISKWGHVPNRFQQYSRIDAAYRAENDKLYLFCEDQYTRYSGELRPDAPDFYADEGYPKQLTSFQNEGLDSMMPLRFAPQGHAILRDAQHTYLFTGASFTRSQTPEPQPLIPTWARVRNHIQSQNRVDAGLVLGDGPNAVTLLFCGDQYVRYSGAYNSFIDEGYPKEIAHLAEAEHIFASLPLQCFGGVRAFFAGTDGALHIFTSVPADPSEVQLYGNSANPGEMLAPRSVWGIIDNKLFDQAFVSAALLTDDKKLFLFSADQYVRYSREDRTYVDEGYPKRVATGLAKELGTAKFAEALENGVEAALKIGETCFFFAGQSTVSTDNPTVAQPLIAQWGRVENSLHKHQQLDAAFVAPNGKLVLFAQTQYSVYSGANRTYVDEGFPKTIASNIGQNWPYADIDFRQNLDTVATFEGKTYVFKNSKHVRMSDFHLERPDVGYPMDTIAKFADRPDLELGHLPDFWDFKQHVEFFSSQTTTLLQYFNSPQPGLAADLARATQWPASEITALLAALSLSEAMLKNSRTVSRLARCFGLADRFGTLPSKLREQLWNPVFGGTTAIRDFVSAADFLYGLIKAATDPKDWPHVSSELRGPLDAAKRDALVAYLVHRLDLLNADDLYEHLLTDVQMNASATTSKIVEAINSIQLYYHRALIHLEDVESNRVWANLKAWWPWMKNYRIWEANRRVFLHPENYIRPELRTEKSPAFEELEEKLLQDEVTSEALEESYQRYLDAFSEISQLRIAGGHRYAYEDEAGTARTAVLMLGYSRTSPPTYYYRIGALSPEDQIDWEPWQKVGISIDATRVQPVYAFNKLFLFWIEKKPYNASSFQISGDSSASYSADTPDARNVKLVIKYSFYNFNKEWGTPQPIRMNPKDLADPEALPFYLSPEAAAEFNLDTRSPLGTPPGDMQDFISLKLRYHFFEWNVGRLTAGLDLEGSGCFWQINFSLFGAAMRFPTQIGIKRHEVSAIIPWGSPLESDTSWFSFEAKGGSFLCRPMHVSATIPGTIKGRAFGSVSAAFDTSNGDLFVFTSEIRSGRSGLCYYHYISAEDSWREPVFADEPAWPWGRPRGVFQHDPGKRIDNAFVAVDSTTYMITGSGYFSYPSSGYGAISQHYARDLTPRQPALEAIIGTSTPPIPWKDALAAGRNVVRAFKYLDNGIAKAVLLTAVSGALAYAAIDLAELRHASKAQDKTSPFDSWNELDTVFLVSEPELCVVFSSGKQLVILTWSSKDWSTGTLGVLPGNGGRLSAAFTGVDGKLYFFSGDHYSEADPLDLTANQLSLPVAERWGKPSLFAWLLTSVDGALIGTDGRLYIFSKDKSSPPEGYCLCYPNFSPAALDNLHVDDIPPPKVTELWRSTLEGQSSVDVVTAAYELNGQIHLYGQRRGDGQAFTARYSQSVQSPFAPDWGYPIRLPGAVTRLSTDFYAALFAADRAYAITRLTSHTVEQFSRRLFGGGIKKLLSLETQGLEELPRFREGGPGGPNELVINPKFVADYPGKGSPPSLDFRSPNGFYYWEIFFHIPFLLAQALKQAQRFQEAKTWYEYVFDPTAQEGISHFRFIEFLKDVDLKPLSPQIDAYHADPFDPHKIAELRPIAYRKAFVMSYIDNLITWGDMLFRQNTRESIGEATMLYVLAADLLGKAPEPVGKPKLGQPDSLTYMQIRHLGTTVLDDDILELENGVPPAPPNSPPLQTPNDSIFNPYFYIPENEQFIAYWNRVGDRLFKIRHGQNIEGVQQSLALFSPPVDVMTLVRAFAAGGGQAQALSEYTTPVPHYRFTFMLAKARDLTARLGQLGSALLLAIEKKDAEELNLLRNTQERGILEMTLQIRQQQLESAQQSLEALHAGLRNAQARQAHYLRLLAEGLSMFERLQIVHMIIAQLFSQISNIMSISASIGGAMPNISAPMFSISFGGQQLGGMLSALAQSFKTISDGFNFRSSLAATFGGWDRRRQDWELQMTLASGDIEQIGKQIRSAEIQVEIAQQEVQVQRQQIKNNLSVDTFMKSKFSNQKLYQWMVGKLSAVYFQTYQIALDYAKAAQRALQFELGRPESEFQNIGVHYWDSLKKGLLAGEQLQLDLDRLEKAYLERNQRRLEITRYISLAQLDPLALLKLKEKGICEFDLGEALFDLDFPGHYCRQLKSVSLSFPAVVGPYDNFNATLTQLTHRTLLSPDKAALKYLLQGPDRQNGGANEHPASILRVDWRPNQQVALSRGTNDNGLFQLNFQDERYLPFEGTGAVSTWRLEVNGEKGHLHRESLSDVVITLQYTASSGGDAFTETVKNAVGGKTRERVWLLNCAYDFPNEWQAFMNDPAKGLSFAVERGRLPGATAKQVTSIFLHYDTPEDPPADIRRQSIFINDVIVKPGSFKTGLGLPLIEKGEDPTKPENRWCLKVVGATGAAKKFTRENIKNIALVVSYLGKVSF